MDIALKTICLVRHAKSSWDYPLLPDIERPLNARGLRDAPFMAEQLQAIGVTPDLILTSPAVRARETAKYFRRQFNLPKKQFLVKDHLYGADPLDVIEIVQNSAGDYSTVLVFGHNPTTTMLANMFPGVAIDNVPTCGILQAKTMVDEWEKWTPDVSAFVGFYYPKQYVR